MLVALLLPAIPATADERVASVLGEEIMRGQLARDDREPAQQFAALIWPRIARHYVDKHGLNATAEELAELEAYDDAFEKKDRAQRKRKLAELEQRLGSNDLSPGERAHTEDFRDTLRRLEQYRRRGRGAAQTGSRRVRGQLLAMDRDVENEQGAL